MNVDELLLTSSLATQQCTTCLWDYRTLNVQKYYKNGGTIAPKCLEVLGQDYLLGAELGKPLIHVWPLNSQDVNKNIRIILPEPATCLTICPKNVYLAVGIDCKLYIWHLSSGQLLSVQQKHYQPISCIKYSTDGDFILTGGQDGMLVAYKFADLIAIKKNYLAQTDLGQVEPIYVKNDHSMPIRDLHIGHFGSKSRFATVSYDQTCKIYNLYNGDEPLSLIFEEPLTSVIFDAPCWQLFVGTEKGSIKQYNLKEPPPVLYHHIDAKNSMSFDGHTKKIVSLALNICNNILASASDDNYVFTWDIKSKQMLKKIEHKASVTNIKFILNCSQFFVDNFKPKIVVKNLERSIRDQSDFIVSQIQPEDIDFSDDEDLLSEYTGVNSDLIEENKKLRIINKQLYVSALAISKKYNKETKT